MANYQSAYTGAQHDLYTTRQSLIDLIYPVGAIYISVASTDPSSLFGGTWERIRDQFLLCAGDTYTAGSIGGNATHSHTTQAHTLTINEIPSHRHNSVTRHSGTDDQNFSGHIANAVASNDTTPAQDQLYTGYTGGGAAHTHGNTGTESSLPPYLAVYAWQRTA